MLEGLRGEGNLALSAFWGNMEVKGLGTSGVHDDWGFIEVRGFVFQCLASRWQLRGKQKQVSDALVGLGPRDLI